MSEEEIRSKLFDLRFTDNRNGPNERPPTKTNKGYKINKIEPGRKTKPKRVQPRQKLQTSNQTESKKCVQPFPRSRRERLHRLAQPRRRYRRRSFIEYLPGEDLRCAVFQFLSIQDLNNLSCTCSELRATSANDILWRDKYLLRVKNKGKPEARVRRNGNFKQAYAELVLARFNSRKEKLGIKWKSLKSRGIEHSLWRMFDYVKPQFTVKVDGSICELMPIRTRKQQGIIRGFQVHAPSPAPNVAPGALKFDNSCTIKVRIPSSTKPKSIVVEGFSKCLGNSRRPTCILSFQVNNWTSSETYEGTNLSLITYSVNNSSVCLGMNQGETVMIVINIHLADIITSFRILNPVHSPIIDDVDTRYGLHDYTCAITLRTFGSVLWQAQFRDIYSDSEDQSASLTNDIRARSKRFTLLAPEKCVNDVTREISLPSQLCDDEKLGLYCRTEAFTGFIKSSVIVDFTLWDEHGDITWCFSKVLPLRSSMSNSFDHTDVTNAQCSQAGVGRFELSYSKVHLENNKTSCLVYAAAFELENSFLEKWFPRK